ncbi:hypothetical protein RUM44_013479 [Polyplax serrata]|uniref:Uncharacterized protein n=1 Tax=Polyplax serrata TaxID=468196 RepID=A0ABR1BG75_POLSC
MSIFIENREKVAKHNLKYLKGGVSYKLRINHMSDLTTDEVNNLYGGLNKNNKSVAKKEEIPYLPPKNGSLHVPNFDGVPEAINWVKKRAVTPVKQQGQCWSCYAFASIAAIESRYYIKNKKLQNLSAQNVVDCSRSTLGCRGGWPENVYKYVMRNKGINNETIYPYESREGKCRYKPKHSAAKVKGYRMIKEFKENHLKSAVASGPVAVCLDASLHSFHQYGGGIYKDDACNPKYMTHAVLAVGYGKDPVTKEEFWLIKNSWSEDWGEKGYMKLARNANNMCGIATHASYPII